MAELYEIAHNFSAADVVVPTTTETPVIATPVVTLPFRTHRVLVQAWFQLTVGTGTTALTVRVRRGTSAADPLVGEANAQAVTGAAGSTEALSIMVVDEVSDRDTVQYTVTVQQTAATGNGTVLQAAIVAMVT